jgi:phosphoribosylaminoimidazolecarboxamide formyltransferase / IMP cyclohydrolase
MRPAAAIIKHTNPCGCAEKGTLAESYRKAFECDPVSAYGGVIGSIARWMKRPPANAPKRLWRRSPRRIFAGGAGGAAGKKNLRLMRVAAGGDGLVVKSISGGYLAQTPDTARLDRAAARGENAARAQREEWIALEFAWKVAKHVKSNAIVFARAGQTVGWAPAR